MTVRKALASGPLLQLSLYRGTLRDNQSPRANKGDVRLAKQNSQAQKKTGESGNDVGKVCKHKPV